MVDVRAYRASAAPFAIATWLLVPCLAGCGAAPPPVAWPARPFTAAALPPLGEAPGDRIARALYEDRLPRLEAALGPYVADGGTLVEGTITTPAGTWPLVGAAWAANGYSGLSLQLRDGDGYVSVDCEPESTDDDDASETPPAPPHCEISTSLVPATYGRVPASVALPTTTFDATVGWEPDEVPVHVSLVPADRACPDWVLRAARTDVAQHGTLSDEGTVWAHVEEGEEGRSTSRDGDRCCWERAHYRVRSWIEARCPGRYGVDVVLSNVESLCGTCAAPPAGCH